MSDLTQGHIVTERLVSDTLGVTLSTITGLTEPTISYDRYKIKTADDITLLQFHTGELVDGKANGILNETLVDVLIHRLELQQESVPCKETELALAAMLEARAALSMRITRRAQETA